MDHSSCWALLQLVLTLPCMDSSVNLLLTELVISKLCLWGEKLTNMLYCRMIRDDYPAVWAWIRLFEDLSGVDPDKSHCDNQQYLTDMLQFASDVYLPFLEANSEAVEAKMSTTSVTLWQETSPVLHQQPAFKYQYKCYQRIKESYHQLSKEDKEKANILFSRSNCIKYL